jgi:hypothetical protein
MRLYITVDIVPASHNINNQTSIISSLVASTHSNLFWNDSPTKLSGIL